MFRLSFLKLVLFVDKPKTCLGSNGVASVPNEHFNSNKQSVHEMNPPIKKVMVQTTPHVDQSTNRVRNVPSSKLGNNVLGQPLKYKDNSFMSNTGRKRNQKKATPSRRFMKPAFVIEEYSEEFPVSLNCTSLMVLTFCCFTLL